jgi:hypothetical protein
VARSHRAPTLQRRSWFLRAGDTVETKRAAHPFSAIRMRSLNDPHQGSLPTVQTVKPLSRCTTPASRCKPSHPSPSAHQFRLPFNWLAPSELRRIFCTDEGAGAAMGSRDTRDGGLGHVGGAVDIRRRGCVPVTRLKQKEQRTGFRQSRCDRSTILARARFQPCKPSHP